MKSDADLTRSLIVGKNLARQLSVGETRIKYQVQKNPARQRSSGELGIKQQPAVTLRVTKNQNSARSRELKL